MFLAGGSDKKNKSLGLFCVCTGGILDQRLCVYLRASGCVPPSVSILDQCEVEAVVIKRIRCFLM